MFGFLSPQKSPSTPKSTAKLEKSITALTDEQKELILKLYTNGQSHLFENFVEDTVGPAIKRKLAQQLVSLDKDYSDGGLLGYISNAQKLLENSRKGVNPLEGWVPSVPQGESLELGTSQYDTLEADGMKDLGTVGFVLVAGGLGERLGYGGIKVRGMRMRCVCCLYSIYRRE